MAVQDRSMTADEFLEYANLPDNADKLLELHEGTLIEMTPSSAGPTMVGIEMGFFIRQYVKTHPIGRVTGADGGFIVAPKTVLVPDVGYISKERQPVRSERLIPAAPDLAVEVVSPTDSLKAVDRKAALYLRYGTHIVWIIYPKTRTASVCHLASTGEMIIQKLGIDDSLSGEDILPDFSLSLRELFHVLDE